MYRKHEESTRLIEEILHEDRLCLSLEAFQIEEQLDNEPPDPPSRVVATLRREPKGESITLEGAGVGAFDAFFVALKERFSKEFSSLKEIRFVGIKVRNIPDTENDHPTAAEAEVVLRFQNIDKQDYYFQARARSMLRANMLCILQVIAFFADCERACKRLQTQIREAQDANDNERLESLQSRYKTLAVHLGSHY